MVIQRLLIFCSLSLVLALFGMVLVGESSNATDMCNPNEPPTVCALVEQRNNALDELAVAEGARRTEVAKRKDEAEFWRQYVIGLVDSEQLKGYLQKVCSWRERQQDDPTGELCRWWDTNYVPHPPKSKGVK
jgi:hypothetical protein